MFSALRSLCLWLFLATASVLTTTASTYAVFLRPQQKIFLQPTGGTTLVTSQAVSYPALDQVKGISVEVSAGDARAALVANFLRRYNSPLQPHDEWGKKLVDIADKYCIDFRLLPAIAMQESNLCKNIPDGTYNCLGFGIHEKGTLGFENFEANFDRAARELKKFYIDKGRNTPEEIMRKYTPSSDGSWANSVNQWMSEMKYNDRQLGRDEDVNHNVLELECPWPKPE